jgi:queuine tRNA-ribosyltransferase
LVEFSPESVVAIQESLGPDIAMQLDVCIGLPAPEREVRDALELTLRWGERSLRVRTRDDQALFGIVQGGVSHQLRVESAARTAALGFDGFGIGGLSVGETREEMLSVLDVVMPELPEDKARYVMGLGDTEGVLGAIARGADLFDCVWPTRLARHGRVLTEQGDYNLRRAEFADDPEPLASGCRCHTCSRHQRAYIRHLLMTKEISALRLITVHNLTYVLDLMSRARAAISRGSFDSFRNGVLTARAAGWRR